MKKELLDIIDKIEKLQEVLVDNHICPSCYGTLYEEYNSDESSVLTCECCGEKIV